MINQQHPITPPPELVSKWLCSDDYLWGPLEQTSITITTNRLNNVATQAAQWGADQELEACKQWLTLRDHVILAVELGFCMRNKPKPPSLKDQALQVLASAPGPDYPRVMTVLNADEHALIRRALKALPND